MKIRVICIGKTAQHYLQAGEEDYLKRLGHYVSVEKTEIPDLKDARKLSQDQIREKEGQVLLSRVNNGDTVYLLDESGKGYSSAEFSAFLQKQMNRGIKSLVFLIGGAYGFSEEVYRCAEGRISLSSMTFSHQMVRMIFLEQLYRGFTILKGEPYHHG